jgi:hypothetical protein
MVFIGGSTFRMGSGRHYLEQAPVTYAKLAPDPTALLRIKVSEQRTFFRNPINVQLCLRLAICPSRVFKSFQGTFTLPAT